MTALAQLPSDLGTAFAALVGSAPSLAALIYLVIYFFRHIATERADSRAALDGIAKRSEDAHAALVTRVEQIASDFNDSVRESQTQSRQTTDQLIAINREAVGAMGAVSGRVGDLSGSVQELKGNVKELHDSVTDLSGSVNTLAVRVDRIDGTGGKRG